MTEPIKMQGGNTESAQNVSNRVMPQQMAPPQEVAEKLGLVTEGTSAKCVTAEDLLAGTDTAEEIEIEGVGVVKIKPLSMGTSLKIQKASKGDVGKSSVWIIQQALVEPRLTPDQIQQIKVGTMTKIVEAINKVSGIQEEDSNLIENF